jgi:hypothetical protein
MSSSRSNAKRKRISAGSGAGGCNDPSGLGDDTAATIETSVPKRFAAQTEPAMVRETKRTPARLQTVFVAIEELVFRFDHFTTASQLQLHSFPLACFARARMESQMGRWDAVVK